MKGLIKRLLREGLMGELEIKGKTPIGKGKDHVVYDMGVDNKKVIKVGYTGFLDPNPKQIKINPNHINIMVSHPDIFAKVYKVTDNYAIIEKLDTSTVRDDEKSFFNIVNRYKDDFMDLTHVSEFGSFFFNISKRKGLYQKLMDKVSHDVDSSASDIDIFVMYMVFFKRVDELLKKKVDNLDLHSGNIGFSEDGRLKLLDF